MNALTKFHNIVAKEIARYGSEQMIIRTQNDEDNYDPATGVFTPNTMMYFCKVLLFDLTLQSNGSGMVGKTLIEAGDKQALVQPFTRSYPTATNILTTIIPEKDILVVGGKYYKIVTFKEINPSNSESVIWDLYVRE